MQPERYLHSGENGAGRRDGLALRAFLADVGGQAVAADREVASLLGEVDPGAFEEADPFAKVGSPLLLPFLPSLHLCLDFSAVPPCVQLKGYKDIPQLL